MAAANACSVSEADDSGAKWTYEQVTDKLPLYTDVYCTLENAVLEGKHLG